MDQSSSEPCGVGDQDGVQGLNTRMKSLNISSDSTNNNAEAWKRWSQQLDLYLLATGLDRAPEKRKIAILLHLIGEKGLNIYNTFNLNIDKTTLAEVKQKFNNFFEPRRNITMCRHMFFTRRQKQSESIEGFLADLENKSQDCEFGTLKESLIRDIFIANLHMDLAHVRQRLLQEPDLTYQRMRELARTLIVAQQDAEKIVSSSEKQENVMHLRRRSRSRGDRRQRASPVGRQGPGTRQSPNPERRTRPCSRCGQSHRYKCPAQGVQCRSCNSFGHFAKFCFKNKNVSRLESFNSNSNSSQDHYFIGTLKSHCQSHIKSNKSTKYSHYNVVSSKKSVSTQSHRQSSLSPPQLHCQSPSPPQLHCQSPSEWSHKDQLQLRNDSDDETYVMSERSHRDSYCQSEKIILMSNFCDDSGDNVMSKRSKKNLGDESSHLSEKLNFHSNFCDDSGENVMSKRSKKNLGDENSHQSEKYNLISYGHNLNKCCDSQSVYLNDEYRHMSEESPHTLTPPHQSHQSLNNINTVQSEPNINKSKQSWNINLKVGNLKFNCIIDSGADLNIMSKQTFNYLKHKLKQLSIVKSHINVTGFSGKSIPIMGKVNIKCNLILNNNNVSENIVFIVANLECPNVLGLPTCERLGIIKRVFSVSKQNFCQQILTKYNDVFQGLGCLPPVCHLKLKPDAVPCVDPPRRVPFALLGKLREELDRMESMKVIEKVTKPTEWVNSIVITVKSSVAHSANYCIVMAQLYTNGQCHGIHPFIVQLRDEETHMPLRGIKVGEIGAKLGMNGTNNGFLGFDHVRIPREHMLMKNSQVLEDGTYVKSPSSKLTYGTMMFVRVVIVKDMCNYIAKAVTIATRYSAVRRQSQPKPDEPEPQILDYLTQQHKLMVGISTAHAFQLSAEWIWNMYNNVTAELDAGDLERLPELHALSCCLKAITTADAAECVERCRLACGGHGYMLASNLPHTYGLVTAACTYEGENTVLLLQTARYLVKAWQQAQGGNSLPPTVAYLSRVGAGRRVPPWDNSIEGIIHGFQLVAAGKIALCVANIEKRQKNGMSYEDAWNMTSVQLTQASESHCRAFILSSYFEETERQVKGVSPQLREVLLQLVDLYVVYWALQRIGDLLRFTSISERDIEKLQHWYEELLTKLRPNAVGLVDAFDLRDEILHSALGAYDGRVYERLMEEALKSPLNAEPVNQSFHKYLKPFMQGKL